MTRVSIWAGLTLILGSTLLADGPPRFVRGVNLNGPAVTIDGRHWESGTSKTCVSNDRAFESPTVPLKPATDESRALMIRSSRWNSAASIQLTELPPGDCTVFVYVWEDNNSETISVFLQGEPVARDFRTGEAGEWHRLGPYPVRIGEDGRLRLTTQGGHANLSGIEIWQGAGRIPGPGELAEPPLPKVSPAVAAHFREVVAPLLARHCLECHNESEPRGGLNLENWLAAAKGGDSGPALVPGKPEESLLWDHVASNAMPRDRPPLTDTEKQALRHWILSGAGWADRSIDRFLSSTDRRAGYDWWSLQPLKSPSIPDSKREWGQNPIDAFISARLAREGLSPAPPADRRTLVRRLCFDLTGLPPSAADFADVLLSDDPSAVSQLIDRLLASPHYGERWARHWLDVVRFGESQGFERNRIRENAWRYRDWVIDAFNRNLPFDEFVRRQIAGDVLFPDDLNAWLATGYHVIGTWDQVGFLEGSKEMQRAVRQDDLEDLVGTLGQTFLGLTLHCARCHDHKFDPVPQRDYYRMAALLSGIGQQEKERSDLRQFSGNDALASQDFSGTAHVPVALPPVTTFLLARGDVRQPRNAVAPAGLSALVQAGLPDDLGLGSQSSDADRRRQLAAWLTDPRNPLPARVFVNRVWHHHFGKGLVETPSDFGFNGGRPSHPDLLDFLAKWFIDSGWDVKALQKLIVESATYQQASHVRSEGGEARDSGNRLLWRASRRRLEGEAVRDAVLAVSGMLNPQLGGPSFRDVHVNLKQNHEFTMPTGEFSAAVCRRSIYRLWARSGNHPLLEGLDCPDPTVAAPRRVQTMTPLQSLSLLNNPFMEQCAREFARRVRSEAGDAVEHQVQTAFRRALFREITQRESRLAAAFTHAYGLEQLCLTLFNTNEFLFVD